MRRFASSAAAKQGPAPSRAPGRRAGHARAAEGVHPLNPFSTLFVSTPAL